ncbi:MAG TPA: protein kinase [Thermoanaerobaculia bacterium]|nr:protein kinase [Thermoanaerobaculia bacterium]
MSSVSQMATALATPSVERAARRPVSGSGVGRLASSDSIDAGAFTPGTVIADRYRIIGLLGRGGMGEVYRADDLKLGHPVALKFLPEELSSDPSRLERFYAEVRLSRQVSHPNVCRVYDVAELDGQHYLTMEYIDGEDLASLLKRIGRLPADKALEISQQLCAGLAAAHDKGVLHRDLKPSNVMLDGRGRARITDFGLAVAAEEAAGGEVSGTPAYMAPEQLAGRAASARSDIYSLGLVLYEISTGRKAFDALTLKELIQKKESESPRPPSDINREMNPVVERVILRCLDRDPRLRPATALQVAAALPGGDPLAAALAAGETPSPEMVAASGEVEGLRPAVAWACLSVVLVGLAASVWLSPRAQLLERVGAEMPPEVLTARAHELLQQIGYRERPVDEAVGFRIGEEYLRYVRQHDKSPSRWDHLERGGLQFWYRQSPRPLVPRRLFPSAKWGKSVPSYGRTVNIDDPPPDISGMATVFLTPRGDLTGLLVVPAQVEAARTSTGSPDWNRVLTAAGFDPTTLVPVDSQWTPPVFADARAAWQGILPEKRRVPIRIEAASYRGRPVYFETVGPWTTPERMQQTEVAMGEKIQVVILLLLLATFIAGGALLARRNLRLGRGDRRGATRLALFALSVLSISWLIGAKHVASIDELVLFFAFAGLALFESVLLWVLYVALEPLVRRRWPQTIVSWSRLLSAGPGDPLVGRDVLVGCIMGSVIGMVPRLASVVGPRLGFPPRPQDVLPTLLLGTRPVIAETVSMLADAIVLGFGMLLVLFLLRMLLRSEWAAATAFVLLLGIGRVLESDVKLLAIPVTVIVVGGIALVFIRFGLVAGITTLYFDFLVNQFPFTTDASSWYFGVGLFAIALIAAISIAAFRISLGARPAFSGVRVDG